MQRALDACCRSARSALCALCAEHRSDPLAGPLDVQQLHKGSAELRVRDRVRDRVHCAVRVPDPDHQFVEQRSARRLAEHTRTRELHAEGDQFVHGEEGQPAQHEQHYAHSDHPHTHRITNIDRILKLKFISTNLICIK